MYETLNLADLCRKWQEILRLQDWRIDIQWAGPKDRLKRNDRAKIEWLSEEMRAWIRIREPESMKRKFGPTSIDHTLVHELIHLKLEGYKARSDYDPAYEAGVDHIAYLLFDQYQKNK